jgi:Na+-transporting methylmalonyl-CoA/oxaloacetate decarboxylase beta subunit
MFITVKFSLFYIGDEKNFEHSLIIPQKFAFLFESINGVSLDS